MSPGNPLEEIGRFLRTKAILPRLILINAVVWLIAGIVRVISFLFDYSDADILGNIVDYLALPASLPTLLERPWTLLTYMFLHLDFFHILFNLLWLFWFGKIFLEFLKARQMFWVYLLGGFSGGLLYVLFYNIFPVFEKSVDQSFALGASASVMAIVTAISFYVPGYTVHLLLIGRVRIIFIALVLFVLDFFMIRSSNAGGHIAHIGGALFGFFYILTLGKGMNFSGIFPSFRNLKVFRRMKPGRRKSPFSSSANGSSRPVTDDEYNARRAERQKMIDAILDKISKSGYESLTSEEKEFLFRSGRDNT